MEIKLKRPSAEAYSNGRNELAEPAILESVSGVYRGRNTIITSFIDFSKSPNTDLYNGEKIVLAVGPSSQGYRTLDEGTSVEYDYDKGVISFSSNQSRYIIRAIQKDDMLTKEAIPSDKERSGK